MKKFLIGLLFAVLVSTVSSTPVSAEDNLSYGDIPSNATEILKTSNGYGRVSLDERSSDTPHSSLFVLIPSSDGVGDWEMCTDVTKGFCKNYPSKRLGGNSILPICGIEIENCIDQVSIYREGASATAAIYKENIDGYKVAGNKTLGVPTGTTTAIFDAPEAPHTGGSEYSVIATIGWGKDKNAPVQLDTFDLRVAATTEVEFPGAKVSLPENCRGPEGGEQEHTGVCGGWSFPGCVYSKIDKCGKSQLFAENTRVSVTLKLSNKFTGWLRGRIKDPRFSVKKINSDFNLVTIDASPVTVPRLFTQYKISEVGANRIQSQGTTWGRTADTLTYSYHADSKAGVEVVGLLRKSAKDTGSGETNLWTVSSFDSSYKRCLSSSSQLQGIVTTNAMAYMGTEPEWKNGTLNYKVSGMHYLADGKTVATGTYDLVMRSSTARCLYGFSKAPIYAIVSVRSASGEKKTATTVVSEKNGWLKLAAYNFTFSSPSIQVKLTQKKAN